MCKEVVKCEHIIGLWCDFNDSYNLNLKELKEKIKEGKEMYEYCLKKHPSLARKPFELKDYADRRKSTNVFRYNYCPICGEKIDWKSFKEAKNEI